MYQGVWELLSLDLDLKKGALIASRHVYLFVVCLPVLCPFLVAPWAGLWSVNLVVGFFLFLQV